MSPHGVSKEVSFGISVFVISIMVWPMKSRPLTTNLHAQNPAKPQTGAIYFARFSPPLSNIQEWVCPAKDVSLMSRIA